MASHQDYLRMDYERERAGIPLYPVDHPQHNAEHAFAFGLAHRYRQSQQMAQPPGWAGALAQLGGNGNAYAYGQQPGFTNNAGGAPNAMAQRPAKPYGF